jgi:tetratricopeptide (TPR) repeat protein
MFKGLLILYETIAQSNDSILNIAGLSKNEQEKFYQLYIDKLKEEDAKNKLEEVSINSGFGNLNDDSSKDNNKSGKFYFYNSQVAGFGKQEFRKIWGNRPLEDNWRISNKTSGNKISNPLNILTSIPDFDKSKKYELDYYLSRIPTETSELDSINFLRNDAYYKLGLIYKEQFKEYPLAADRLEKLLTFKPKDNLILPIKYNLYKIYSEFNIAQSNKYKEEIVKNYPESRYATIISNPEQVLLSIETDNSPEAVYEDAYCDYDYLRYDEALRKYERAINQFENMPIIPKFELLKAFILLKTKGKNEFIEALDEVSINYPNTEEGKHAVKILESMNATSVENNNN